MSKMTDREALEMACFLTSPRRFVLWDVFHDARVAFGKRRAHTARPGRYCKNPHCEDCAWYRGYEKEAARRRFTAIDPAFGDDHTARVEGVMLPDGTVEIINVIRKHWRTRTGEKEMCMDPKPAFTTAAAPRGAAEPITFKKIMKAKYEVDPPRGRHYCGHCYYSFPKKKHFCVADPVIPGYTDGKPKQFAEVLEVFTGTYREVMEQLKLISSRLDEYRKDVSWNHTEMCEDFLDRIDNLVRAVGVDEKAQDPRYRRASIRGQLNHLDQKLDGLHRKMDEHTKSFIRKLLQD